MGYVIADPELMTAAATDLANIASNVNAAHMVAAARTVGVLPAAADEVSASIAQLFSQHAANCQALAGQAAAFNDQFVQHLTAGSGSYTSAEGAIAASLQDWQNLNVNVVDLVINLPALYLEYLSAIPALPPQQQIPSILNLPLLPLDVILVSAAYALLTSLP